VRDDRQTTDRQTDNTTEKCVDIGGIACASAIPFSNTTSNNANSKGTFSLRALTRVTLVNVRYTRAVRTHLNSRPNSIGVSFIMRPF